MAPSAQLVTWPLDEQLPWLEEAAPGVSPAGRVTCSDPFVARAGPVFASVSWYVSVSPTFAGSGDTVPVSARFARGVVIVLSRLSVLFDVSGSASVAWACAVVRTVPPAVAVALRRSVTAPPR